MATTDQIGYDTGASGQAQDEFRAVSQTLMQIINEHSGNVSNALANYEAEDVSDMFGAKSNRFDAASNQVVGIINLIQRTMAENDGTAVTGQQQARNHVESI